MKGKGYYPDLIDALRETIRQLQASGYDEAHLQELRKTILLTLAALDATENSGPMAAD